MNNADEEECLRNYENLIRGYNELFDKNIILNNEIEQLRWRIRTLEEKQFKYMDTIQIHYEREMDYVEEIELLKCRLSEKEEESIMTVTNLKSKMCQFQEYLKRILEMERNQQENENTNMCKCCLDTESRSERISVSTQCASENELSSESSISCEHSCDVDDNLKQLVRAIEHCVMSKDTCDPFRSLFEQSKFAICDLIHNLSAERVTLKQCQNDRQYCSKMLNEVQDACKCKDAEICSMKTDLITLSSKLKEAIKDNEYLRRDYGKISQQLSSKTEAEHEWLNGTEGLREELVNMKYALNMRVEEKKQNLKELEEKNRTIEEDVKLKKELENKLNIAEKKLQDSETLKNVCNNECNELSAKNAKLEEELNNANRDNAEKTNNVADLNRQIVDLKTVIKGFDAQRILYEEEITTLKEGTNAVECKSDEEIEKLTIVVETLQSKLTNANSELTGLHGRIQEKDKVNEFQINRIQSLERDIENFAKQVKEYQVQNDLLTKTALIKELEANGLRDEIETLTSRIDKITRDNDEQKKQILRISDDIGDLRRKRAELETLNEELTEKWCSLEQTNLELVANIDKLNDSLVSANKKEIYARKNLVESNEKLSIATKEIENFDLEIRGVNKKFNETSEKLACVEQELRETVSKLAEETSLKDRINKAYSALMEERNRETRMKQMTVGDGVTQQEAVCSECQTEITGKQLYDERSKYQDTLTENERLTQETCSLHKVTNDLRDDVLALKDTNKILRESLDRRYKMAASCCCGSKSSVMSATFRPDSDGGSSEPPVGRDDDEPCRSGLKMDGSTCSCTPHDCSCLDARSAAAKCDCANDDERDKLRCQLNEMLALFTEKERMAQRMLDNAERRHHDNELELKRLLAQCQQRADELCGQVETYETMVRYKERTLTECQSRGEWYSDGDDDDDNDCRLLDNLTVDRREDMNLVGLPIRLP